MPSPTEDARALVDRFYSAFARLDGAAMSACYAEDATFADPAFPELKGPEVGAMWRMLCGSAREFVCRYSIVSLEPRGSGARAVVAWEADYRFSATKRLVHNVITATIDVEGGLIRAHRDVFDLYRWTRMALGLPGVLLGWTPLLQNQVRAQARKGLGQFMKKERGGA